MKWYAVNTFSGQELNVQKHVEMLIEREGLEEIIGQTFVPTQEVVSVTNGRKRTSTRKHLPSYVLIELEFNKETLHYITDIPGVMHFVGANGKPERVKQVEVDRMMGKTPEKEVSQDVIEVPYGIGDVLRITDGPFKDFEGSVEEISPEQGKLTVMVSVFGRSTPVQLSFAQVVGL